MTTAPAAAHPPPAAAAPSTDRRLRIAAIVLCVIGLGIAAYLTYVHYQGIKIACPVSGGCETVQGSVYAKLAGIPVPVLGLVGYAGIIGTLLFVPGDLGRIAGFGMALAGFLFSVYLTYREVFTIKAICPYCVTSAVCMTLLAIITGIRAIRGPDLEVPDGAGELD
jgi:uncharacterized membrane protein